MTAKEMFEKLGYKRVVDVPLLYQFDDGGLIKSIMFVNSFKRIILTEYENYNNKPQGTYTIDLNLLQAINKQVEELEWSK